jgi:SdrD B-like domain
MEREMMRHINKKSVYLPKTSLNVGSRRGEGPFAPTAKFVEGGISKHSAMEIMDEYTTTCYLAKQGRPQFDRLRTFAPTKTFVVLCLLLFTFYFLLFTPIASAQRDINTDLPLVTVGTALGWIPSGDEVEFTLTEDAWVKLSIYSPSLDLTEIGDEIYDGHVLDTTFSFRSNGNTITTQTYQLAPSEWVTFYQGSLLAAPYVLSSDVVGKGKNVYLLKLETSLPDVVLQAHTVTVNVSSLEYADAFTFDITQNNACWLELYDGDGPSELEARLVQPTGYVQGIVVSADLETTVQYLPRLKGTYTVQLRLPPNTYQRTNSVRFKVLCNEQTQLLTHSPSLQVPAPEAKPIVVEVMDTEGNRLTIPYTVSEGLKRDVVLAEDITYGLVEVRAEGGEHISERTVRFGFEGGKVTYILEKLEPDIAAPLPTPEVQMLPPVLVPLPEPKLELTPPELPILSLERGLERDALLPCQVETVVLSVRNDGNAAGPYLLRETIPQGYLIVSGGDAMVEGNTLIWQGELAAGEGVAYSYQLELSTKAQAPSTLQARLETPQNVITNEADLYGYDILTTLGRVSPEGSLYVGDEAEYQITFDNPLDHEVTLTPRIASSRMTVLETPEVVTVPAKSSATATVRARVEIDGTAILRVTPFACDSGFIEEQAAGNIADLREEALSVPPLPQALQSTTVIVGMAAYSLPVIKGLVLVQYLPADSSYVSGSTRINGEVASDPLQAVIQVAVIQTGEIQTGEDAEETRAGSYLIFELPKVSIGEVRFKVLHRGDYWAERDDSNLMVLSPKPEVLIGDEGVLRYYQEAVPLETNVAVRERTGAVILSPATGTVIRSGSSTTIEVDTPLNDEITLYVNDEKITDDRIATKTLDKGVGRQTYEYIGLALVEGRNAIRLESLGTDGLVKRDDIEVYLAGVPDIITITPLTDIVADSATPLEFEVRVEDAWGNAPVDSFVTLEIENATPAERDADEQLTGYQVAFKNGKGLLRLEPLTEPGDITIRAVIGRELGTFSFRVESNLRPWIIDGYGSIGAGYGDGFKFGVGGSFFARGSIFNDYLLTLSAHYPFDPLGPFAGTFAGSFETFPITGSNGLLGYDAFSQQGIYARLERGQSYLHYGDFVTDLQGELIGLSRSYTGLSFNYNPNKEGFGVRGYVAYAAPGDRVTDLYIRSDGTRDYLLPDQDIKLDTLLLEVVKGDCDTPRDFVTDNDPFLGSLQQGVDYVADRQGIIRLVDRLALADTNSNCYYLKANYQRSPQSAERRLQAGAQGSYTFGVTTIRWGGYQETLLNNNFARVISAAASLEDETLRGEIEVAYGQNQDSSGIAATLQVGYTQDKVSAEAKYHFFATGYRSAVITDASSAGNELKVGVGYALTPNFILSLDSQWRQYAEDTSSSFRTSLLANYQTRTDVGLGSILIGSNPTVQFGVQYELERNSSSALRAVIGAGLSDTFGVSGLGLIVTHRQSLGAGTSITDFSVRYQILNNLSLRLTEQVVWGNSSQLIVGLESGFENNDFLSLLCQSIFCEFNDPTVNLGTTRLTAQYEFTGGSSGQAGRISLGANTQVPVTDQLTLNAGASQRLDLSDSKNNETVLSVGAAYDQPEVIRAEASYDLRFGISVKQVIFAGTTFALSDKLFGNITFDYLSENSTLPTSGFKGVMAGAYRGDQWSVLTRQELRTGRFEENNVTALSGDTRVNYDLSERSSLRGSYIYDLQTELGFRDMLSLGVSAYLWDGGNITGYGRLFHDWQDASWSPGLTLEASQKLACGVYGVGGVNAFDGTGNTYGGVFGEPGVFLRLDIVFDEQWTCGAGTISGQAFLDLNADGLRDANEIGLPGISIKLLSEDGRYLKTTYSGEAGHYSFGNLKPDRYILQIEPPTNYRFSPMSAGTDPTRDSDIHQDSGRSDLLEVGWEQHLNAIDIGIIQNQEQP